MKKHLKNLKFLMPVLILALWSFVPINLELRSQLDKNLKTWRINYSPEKVYVHHDKPYYAPGQQIWFKSYVVDAASLKPTNKSQVLYVDLVDEENKPVQQLKLSLDNGKANGDIILPDNLNEGVYRIIAYTQYMRNFGENTFFNKELKILGGNLESNENSIAAGEIDLQFFPEGGDLVNGLKSRVAFKAIGSDGKGVSISGGIFDDQGKKITEFKDHHLGMGAFELEPNSGHRYFAKVNFKDGSTIDYPLPQAQERGYILKVQNNPDQEQVEVTVEGNVAGEEPLVLTGISRDELKFSQDFILEKGAVYRQKVDKDLFSDGVVRINLAKADGEPLAERLTFIDKDDDLKVSISTDKKTYRSREQVTLEVEAKDKNGNPVATDFSLAITDEELVVPEQYGQNIKSYLLLSSDLKGYVENPGYYFESNSEERTEALNLLLMTQGWSRFSWTEAVSGQFPEIKYKNEPDLSISGQLVTQKGKPVKNGEVILYLKDKHDTFIVTETNSDGFFRFEGFHFTDTIDIVVQGTDAKGRREHLQVKMDVDKYVPEAPDTPVPGAEVLSASTSKDFLVASKRQIASVDAENKELTLGELVLKDVVIEGRAKINAPVALHNRADVVINATQLPVAPSGNILESLQGRVAGLQINRAGNNEFRATIRGIGTPLYLLDGVPIHENTLMSISQFDIGRIEILKNLSSAGIYGGRASGGVIALYSKRGGEELVEVEPGTYIIRHRAGGFTKTREFYSPRYSNEQEGTNEPDLRTTLYWNPSVKTNENGKASVTFFTADRNTTYRAVAEGISADGKPGTGVMTFNVEFEEVAP